MAYAITCFSFALSLSILLLYITIETIAVLLPQAAVRHVRKYAFCTKHTRMLIFVCFLDTRP